MFIIRNRIARLFENLFAMAIGALVVCLAKGMTPQEIYEYAVSNAHKVPDTLPLIIQFVFGPGFLV